MNMRTKTEYCESADRYGKTADCDIQRHTSPFSELPTPTKQNRGKTTVNVHTLRASHYLNSDHDINDSDVSSTDADVGTRALQLPRIRSHSFGSGLSKSVEVNGSHSFASGLSTPATDSLCASDLNNEHGIKDSDVSSTNAEVGTSALQLPLIRSRSFDSGLSKSAHVNVNITKLSQYKRSKPSEAQLSVVGKSGKTINPTTTKSVEKEGGERALTKSVHNKYAQSNIQQYPQVQTMPMLAQASHPSIAHTRAIEAAAYGIPPAQSSSVLQAMQQYGMLPGFSPPQGLNQPSGPAGYGPYHHTMQQQPVMPPYAYVHCNPMPPYGYAHVQPMQQFGVPHNGFSPMPGFYHPGMHYGNYNPGPGHDYGLPQDTQGMAYQPPLVHAPKCDDTRLLRHHLLHEVNSSSSLPRDMTYHYHGGPPSNALVPSALVPPASDSGYLSLPHDMTHHYHGGLPELQYSPANATTSNALVPPASDSEYLSGSAVSESKPAQESIDSFPNLIQEPMNQERSKNSSMKPKHTNETNKKGDYKCTTKTNKRIQSNGTVAANVKDEPSLNGQIYKNYEVQKLADGTYLLQYIDAGIKSGWMPTKTLPREIFIGA